jgi:hypothetical protein
LPRSKAFIPLSHAANASSINPYAFKELIMLAIAILASFVGFMALLNIIDFGRID